VDKVLLSTISFLFIISMNTLHISVEYCFSYM